MRYITVEEVLLIHKQMISGFGGRPGILNIQYIESAVFRPQTVIGGKQMFDSVAKKAAAILHALVKAHGFTDGNKRTGLVTMLMFLRVNGKNLALSQAEAVDIVYQIAKNEVTFEELVKYLDARIQ